MRLIAVIVCLATFILATNALTAVRSSSPSPAITAAQGLVKRVLGPQWVSSFLFEPLPQGNQEYDSWELSTEGIADNSEVTVIIKGTSSVAMASGLYYYLRNYCDAQITWGYKEDNVWTGDHVNISQPLPVFSGTVAKTRNSKWSYYQNVCTVSYSMVWWSWERWEREIDWMALHGINLPLAFTGQEAVWYQLYKGLGMTDSELQDFFTGPAFLAWQRMGNLRRWGGPLDADWRSDQADLQKKILARMREFGMTPVLPGFAGHVPGAISRIFPHANLTHTSNWSGFNSTYSSVSLLEPSDPVFQIIGKKYYSLLIDAFGTDHVYNCDTYNEMNPNSGDAGFLKTSNEAVYQAMAAVDSKAIYLMQGWLFYSAKDFWTNDRIKAYLSGVPNDKMIILDLFTDRAPVWNRTSSYFGKPWIWCMLHNFGGRRGLYGNLDYVGAQPVVDLKTSGSTMVGVGLTMEAIDQNPVMYELMSEMTWHNTPVAVTTSWLPQYVKSRYGSDAASVLKAWELLHEAAYCDACLQDRSLMEMLPFISQATTTYTNATGILQSWRVLLGAARSGDVDSRLGPFRYDFTDLTRQVITNLFADVTAVMQAAYTRSISGSNPKAGSTVKNAVALGKQLYASMDTLLSTNVNYLLGKWVSAAHSTAHNSEEQSNRDFNARNQVTLWGVNGIWLNDYAAKPWAGLYSTYYSKRWSIFANALSDAAGTGTSMNYTAVSIAMLDMEQAWQHGNQTFIDTPEGDMMSEAEKVLQAYATSTSNYEAIEGETVSGGILIETWTMDVAQLKILCDLDLECEGFTSDGRLRTTLASRVPKPGITTYLKPK